MRDARTPEIAKATDFIGRAIRNAEGEELGEVVDLAIDGRPGRVVYAVMASGGLLGIGERLYAVPIEALRRSAGGDHLLIDVPRARLEAHTGFDDDHWPSRADARLLEPSGGEDTTRKGGSGARPVRPGGEHSR